MDARPRVGPAVGHNAARVSEATCVNHPRVEEAVRTCARCGDAFCGACRVELFGRPLCSDCKREHVKRLVSGARSRTGPARLLRRALAYLLDLAVVGAPWTLVATCMAGAVGLAMPGNPAGAALFLFGSLALFLAARVGYEGLFLQRSGQTPGKMVFDLIVVTAARRRLGAGQAWARGLVRVLIELPGALLPGFFVVDYLPALLPRRRCVHDVVSGTRVVNWRTGPRRACPLCGARSRLGPGAGQVRCRACGGEYRAEAFAPPRRLREVPEPTAAEGDGCPEHAENAAPEACGRCGRFMCRVCRVTSEGRDLCVGCFERLERGGEAHDTLTDFVDCGRVGLAAGVVPYLVLVPAGVLRLLDAPGARLLVVAGLVLCVTGPVALWCGLHGLALERRLGRWRRTTLVGVSALGGGATLLLLGGVALAVLRALGGAP